MRRLLILPVVLLVAAGCGTTTTRHDFELDARTISSIAAEGALLAQDVAEGDTTHAFAQSHGGELAGTAEELRLTLLRSRALDGVPARRLAEVAHGVSLRLDAVSRRPPEDEARRLAQELDRLSQRAARLEEQA